MLFRKDARAEITLGGKNCLCQILAAVTPNILTCYSNFLCAACTDLIQMVAIGSIRTYPEGLSIHFGLHCWQGKANPVPICINTLEMTHPAQ